MTDTADRIKRVQMAFLEGAKKHFPDVEHAEFTADALIDLHERGLLTCPKSEFERFLASLRDPGTPEPVEEHDE